MLGSDADSIAGGKNVLVADPVYLRRRIDPVTATVDALLDGPTRWFAPVVELVLPEGRAACARRSACRWTTPGR